MHFWGVARVLTWKPLKLLNSQVKAGSVDQCLVRGDKDSRTQGLRLLVLLVMLRCMSENNWHDCASSLTYSCQSSW